MSPRAEWRARLTSRLPKLKWYAAAALLLPGGSLVPFAIWLVRHRAWLVAHAHRALSAVRGVAVAARRTR